MRSNSRALKIEYYQDLYKLYSRLQFSRYEDRPFAIAGLEKRLLQAFDTKGGYGIFDDGDKSVRGLFHRSILWQRGEEKEFENGLVSIDFPAHRNIRVPSWSWMAYQGGIDYVTPPGGTAEWEMNDILEPWTRGLSPGTDSAHRDGIIAIPAIVRGFELNLRLPGEYKLVYDTDKPREPEEQRTQCVIVAKDKHGRSEGTKRHYILLVAPKQEAICHGRRIFERIGAGYILGKYIDLDQAGIEAEIH